MKRIKIGLPDAEAWNLLIKHQFTKSGGVGFF